jgi:hypothetical protein
MFAVQVSHVHVTSYQHIYTTGPTFQHRVAPILGNWGRKEGERDVGGGEGRWGQEGRAGQGREEEAGAVAGCASCCWCGVENSMGHPKEGAGVGVGGAGSWWNVYAEICFPAKAGYIGCIL